MSVTMLPLVDARRQITRDYHCPVCRRFVVASDAEAGTMRVKCPDCREWRVIKLGAETGRISRSAC